MSSKSKSKQEEALQFLDDLDSLNPPPPPAQGAPRAAVKTPGQPPANDEAAEALAFLDEITQKSSEPKRSTSSAHLDKPISRSGTPSLRKSTERVKVGGGSPAPLLPASSSPALKADASVPSQPPPGESSGGWGWGSVWTSASAAIQQARTVVDEQVKNLPKNEQAKKWSEGMLEYAKNVQVDKLGADFKRVGLSTLTDLLNVVAPPISEHEVIQVWLSHDMKGYDGVENLVYRALARIMEQVEGGDLVVNKGDESRPKDNSSDSARELNAVEGYEAAYKLAQAELDQIIKSNAKPPPVQDPSNPSPTTYSHIYLRIQPFTTTYTLPQQADPTAASESPAAPAASQTHLQFILHLSDPWHQLVHTTVTQAVPVDWLEIWDDYDWVEDLVVEALRVGVEVIGQEYIVARMGWGKKGKGKERAPSDEPVVVERPTEA